MRLYGIHAQDLQGVGGALRGQEMAYALRGMGHEILQGHLRQPSRTLFRENRVDAVILTGTWHQLLGGGGNAVLIADACDEYGIPCIWWYGSNGSIWAMPNADAEKRVAEERKIISLVCERPFIGVICPYSMRIYERYGVPREKMRLIPSVFDGDLFHPADDARSRHIGERLRFKFGIPPDAWALGTVGTIPSSKGGDQVIQAVALLKDEMPDLHYVLLHTPAANLSAKEAISPDGQEIGKSERQVLQESINLAHTLNVEDRVHFLGTRFMRVGMPGFYWMLNGYASPSLADNLPQPPIEAQLTGLPFLTHKGEFENEFCFDFCSCPETAVMVPPARRETDDWGLIIPFGDPAGLADGIRRLREVGADAAAMERTRAWAYQKFHHHNAQVMVDAINEMRVVLQGRAQLGVGDQGDDMRIGYEHAAARIETEIGLPGRKVLDVGCNIGAGMEVLARRWPDSRLFGIEPANRYAEIARAKGLKVETAIAEKLPYETDSFDLVFIRHALEHCKDRDAALGEILRILKPDGYCYIQVPIDPVGYDNEYHLSPFRTAAEVRALGDVAGWKEVYWGPQELVAELILRKT